MLFRPNVPEHEAHLLSNRVAIRFSLPIAAGIVTEPLKMPDRLPVVPKSSRCGLPTCIV
jgi:hypothetical protein